MISKLLIANRGEIACRIIRTAKRMGIATVAVYSDADRQAMHVQAVDEAVHIGASAPNESYLLGGKMIEAALATGADAIHPGYGFLSENPDFVQAVEAEGLTFIGPSAAAIRAMGLKDAAKAKMETAGVPVVPGYHGENQDDDFLKGKATEIGFPVLIKAVAGGGGKGMRKVEAESAFANALVSCRSEAKSAFGDERVLIEKYIEQPRHIEVQVFGDSYGNIVHLFERDCSLQRRHQKVIEEAPAQGMTAEVRKVMTEAAVTAARAIGYENAGTIEFIADGSSGLRTDGFWFMEMNTRLQVEHPVTEMVTGLDLVEWQIRVARGEALPLAQEQIVLSGHAVEARLYAEDPAKDFLPATGTFDALDFPQDLRIDTGVKTGDTISPFYDPMVAKMIAHGATRGDALDRLRYGLEETRIIGATTNRPFLIRLLSLEPVAVGELDTGLIARYQTDLTSPRTVQPIHFLIAALVEANRLSNLQSDDLCESIGSFDLWGERIEYFDFELGVQHQFGDRIAVRLVRGDDGAVEAWIADKKMAFDSAEIGDDRVVLDANGHSTAFRYTAQSDFIAIQDNADLQVIRRAALLEAFEGDLEEDDRIAAPMHGLIRRVNVRSGDRVSKGQSLIVVEAMKMEHMLTAPRDAVIAEILAVEGDQVAEGALLIALEEET
jgi:3-methylcrotonyl-CoA carboxylase alpha subunit